MTSTNDFKLPEQFKGSDKVEDSAIMAYVQANLASKLEGLKSLKPTEVGAAFMAFREESNKLESQIRDAIKADVKARNESEAATLKAAADKILTFQHQLETLLVPFSIEHVRPVLATLPKGQNVWIEVLRTVDGNGVGVPTVHVGTEYAHKADSTAGSSSGSGKRGKPSQYSIEVFDAKGASLGTFDGFKMAASVFVAQKDKETNYSVTSFPKKVEHYGWTCKIEKTAS
jgi:hypothetical protein